MTERTKVSQKVSQNEKVIAYITEFGSINPLQALSDLGIMRLASRISDLKKQGYAITRRMVDSRNRYGEKVSFAEYGLEVEKR